MKNQTKVHSFIFYGPNGTGKTTSARLFARAVNCEQFQKLEEICGMCTYCQIAEKEDCIDIVEIDGATHNGVEFVREINKNALYPPIKLPKKLYIIDEAHCLSTQSWNALLKLIEEPPDHLIVILITTEIQKIIPTILSRCQKLNFPALNFEKILPLLTAISQKEQKSIKEDVLEDIIKNSGGSVREALVMLEKHFLDNKTENLTTDPYSHNDDAVQLLQLIFDSQTSNALKKLRKIETNFAPIFESILNHLLELSFYILGNEAEDFLHYWTKQQAKVLVSKKKNITSMINFLATNIYSPNINFSLSYSKFLLLNLLVISGKDSIDTQQSDTFWLGDISIKPKSQDAKKIINEKFGRVPLKAVLSETISDREHDSALPEPKEIFSNSILQFSSFDLPQFEFQEILHKEKKIIQILQECQKSSGEKYYQQLQQYLESDASIPLIHELFKNIHPKYKFICSVTDCLVIFTATKDSQYFNLKLKNWNIQETIYTIFSKPINFYSISLNELPSFLEKKKLQKFTEKPLSSQEEKLFTKLQTLFNAEKIDS
ncbi:DNA polymerase III, subunits gamma and tau [Candidatus Mycoplasma haemominutum 'Birmingham 1']|uniref:DNA polymerase III subunit gamma/tau n=1 Tax=Candidatus Mycoplasma haematominutum 'Birmingham 1' TaxID=1116213 RepID=G8C404_9MOLU|nr:DNA polymerase III, subunits gamma and tau [Candidatus Mycoplasma haematominutum 'Birmingham 1']